MATELKNLSSFDPDSIPNGKGKRVAIVVSEWNRSITGNLLKGAYNTLVKFGVDSNDIIIEYVPGRYELTFGAKVMIEKANVDSVIVLGCVIQGEPPHFTFVCDSVTKGTTQLNLNYDIPVIFGLLTTNTQEQAIARSGGRHGNKGDEAAITALKMIELKDRYN